MEGMVERERLEREEEKRIPHLSNLNEDPALVGKIHHTCKQGTHLTVKLD